MRSKVTLVLIFLNVALFFYIFNYERVDRTERAMLESRRRVFGAEAADIRSLQVDGPAGTVYRIEKRGESWFLSKPVNWPANPSAVNRILNEIQLLEHETSFSTKTLGDTGQSLADYGLAQPHMVLTFTSGEDSADSATPPRQTIVRIGDTTRVGDRLYLLSPDGSTIHVVSRSLADSLGEPLDEIRADTLFTIPVFEARFLSVQSAVASGVRVRVRRDGSRWSFETPVIARASKLATEMAINELDALRVKSFPVTGPGTDPSAAPVLRVSLEGNNRQETLFVGQETGTDHDRYGQLEGRPAVFTLALPQSLLDDLSNPQDRLRDPHVLEFDPHAVTSITLSSRTTPDLVLQRLDAADGKDAEAPWQIVRRDGAALGTPTTPADGPAIRTLLDQLGQLAASRFQSDAPTAPDLESWGFNSPERVVALAVGGTSPSNLMLEIGVPTPRDASAYARVAGSASIYAVDPDILRLTPVSPLAWRDRSLFSLPDTARITAISLTPIGGPRPLYSHRLADAETWESALVGEAPGRRTAILSILDQIRNLRAKAFVQDGFPEHVYAAGEERPWRYRLDASVSLPGGEHGGSADTLSLWLTERTGGTEQLAGSAKLGAVFQIEQPLLDALWTLTYGDRDPGPPPLPAAPPSS